MRKFFIILIIILIVVLFHPGRHAKYYDYVKTSQILNEVELNDQHEPPNLTKCPIDFYQKLLENENEFKPENFTQPKIGGEYEPTDCKAIIKTAIIVPYRNRETQLNQFLNYMHDFLQRQKIHYRIIVVEQNDRLSFNRAKMLNVGANEAMKMNYPCLILHDVDLFPSSLRNLYACFKRPRHMSSSVDTFRYNLPYLGLFGGVIAVQLKHFKLINGMSNVFDGWGGEDDDFFMRLKEYDLVPYRLPPEISRYTMLVHKKQSVGKDRWKKLEETIDRHRVDGLNSIPNNYMVEFEDLYTHVLV